MATITITDPVSGFDMAGAALPVIGTVSGDLTQITIRINSVSKRVNVVAGAFNYLFPIPILPSETPLTIQAFDGLGFYSSTVFSNIVTGEAINVPSDGVVPPNDYWTEDGYETILQSECALFTNDAEKTVTGLHLDFTHSEEAPPLLGHSQIGVGGLPNCIDWWDSEPWPIDCDLHQKGGANMRDTGPMTWPYYSTGRYVAWRIFLSNNPPEGEQIAFDPKGGVIDFNRVRIKLHLQADC